MPKLPAPPVPQKLRELLEDYPECILQLQELLSEFSKPKPRVQPSDEALWLLQDQLASFLFEAKDELTAAEASRDLAAIEKARQKKAVMLHAQARAQWITDKWFWNFFQENKEAFK